MPPYKMKDRQKALAAANAPYKKPKPAPTPGAGSSASGGKFTPYGFVPNKATVVMPTDQAPYKHGKAPRQQAVKLAAAATGEINVVDNGPSHSDAQRHAQTLAIQRMLNAHGAKLALDGQWGPQTESAYHAYLHHTTKVAKAAGAIDASRNIGYKADPFTPSPEQVYATHLVHSGHHSVNFDTVRQVEDDVKKGRIDQQTALAALQMIPKGKPGYLDRIPGELKDATLGQAEQLGQMVGQDILAPAAQAVTRNLPGYTRHGEEAAAINAAPTGDIRDDINTLIKGTVMMPVDAAQHPLRNPVMTVMSALMVLDPAARLAAPVRESIARDALTVSPRKVRVDSPEARQVAQALRETPGITRKQAKHIQNVYAMTARALAQQTGIDPVSAYRQMIRDARAHNVAPDRAQAQALAQQGAQFQHANWATLPIDIQRFPKFVGKLPALVEAMPPKVTIQELRGKIKSAAIKDDEIKWSKFDTFLKDAEARGAKSVTQDEARAWLDTSYLTIEENRRLDPNSTGDYSRGNDPNSDLTKFGTYTIPGGSTSGYQEFTIRLPESQYGELYSYRGHFPDSNILAHVRTTDRNVAGDHTLMIEEIQSDWHQAGQKEGYRVPVEENPDYQAAITALHEAAANLEPIKDKIRKQITDSLFNHPELPGMPQGAVDMGYAQGEHMLGLQLNGASEHQISDWIAKAEQIETAAQDAIAAGLDATPHVMEMTPDEARQRYYYATGGYKVMVGDTVLDRNVLQAGDESVKQGAYAAANRKAMDMHTLLNMTPESRAALLESLHEYQGALYAEYVAGNRLTSINNQSMRGVADAPFKKTWHELAFKRMLAEAVEKGYKRIAWTTGRTQAERYQLANFFDRIEIQPGSGQDLYDWAEEMARNSVDDMDDESLGFDSYREEQLRTEAADSSTYDYPSEDDYYIDPETGQTVESDHPNAEFDQASYDSAMEDYQSIVDDTYDQLLEEWRSDARDSMQRSEEEYFRDNASEYDFRGGSYLVRARTPNGQWQEFEASEPNSGEENALENVIGPDLAKQYEDHGQTEFEGDNLMAGENTKSAAGAAHFYDNKLTGFVNKFLKKIGVQTSHEEIGNAKGAFKLRVNMAFANTHGNSGYWILEGRGDYPIRDYFDALAKQNKDFGDIPRPVIEHGDRNVSVSPDKPEIWVRWTDFPKEVKISDHEDPAMRGTHGQWAEGWGSTRWGPYDSVEAAKSEVEDSLINMERQRGWSDTPGAGTVVHSIPVTDEVRAFVDQGLALFQADPLVKAIKKEHGIGEPNSKISGRRMGDALDIENVPKPARGEPNQALNRFSLHEHIGQLMEQRQGTVKGAVILGGERGSSLHLFKGADVTTPIHELGHIVQQYAPESGLSPEEFARSFEQYVIEGKAPTKTGRRSFRALAKAMKTVYKEAPGQVLGKEERALFNDFFRSVERNDNALAKLGGIHPQEDMPTYRYSLETNPDATTLHTSGQEIPVKHTEQLASKDNKPFHVHAHDSEGNLVAAMHGFARPDEIHVASVFTKPEHEGNGIASHMLDIARSEGNRTGKDVNSVFANKALGRSAARKSVEQGRTAYSDAVTKRTHFQQMTEEELKAQAENVRKRLKGARSVFGKQKAGYSPARAEKFAKAAAILENESLGTPMERHVLAKAQLRGELPTIDFMGFKELDDDAINAMVQVIHDHPNLSTTQRITAADALAGAVDGRVPRPHEILILEHVFGKVNTTALRELASHPFRDAIMDLLNVPRSLMASFDLSAPFRQGLVAGARHPMIFAKNFKPMLKAMKSQEYHDSVEKSIRADVDYPLAIDAKLSLTDFEDKTTREERYFSNAAERIPLAGIGVKGSARAYVTFLNKMRMDMFKYHIRAARQRGIDVNNVEFLRALGELVNSATGRGGFKHEQFERAAPALNTFLFSPRLLKSRLNFLDPTWYKRLKVGDEAYVRQQAIRSFVTLGAEATAFLTAISMVPGVTVNIDPRNPDWGKVKFGNTRFDIGGGFQQPIRLAAQLATGVAISSTTGKATSLTAGGFGKSTRLDTFIKFWEGKESPIASLVTDKLRGSDMIGNKFSWSQEAWQHLVPLLAQDTYDLYTNKDGAHGWEAAVAGYAVGGIGFGMQTYGPKEAGKTQRKTLTERAKKAGLPAPPKEVLLEVKTKAELDTISQQTKGDVQKRLKEYIDYYAKKTGDHSLDAYKGAAMTDKDAEDAVRRLRTVLIGSGLSEYESAIKRSGVK